MPEKTQSFAGGSHAAFQHTCPKCGSAEVRRLALIHEAGLSASPTQNGDSRVQSALSRHAAPPSKKNVAPWAVLACAAMAMALVSLRQVGSGTIITIVVAFLSAAIAIRANRYNGAVYPRLCDLWLRSFMCGRCGEVFSE
jgi:predicted RNA-binding Zn-ribbon protein involved in translation (DUF1610 family)